MSHTENPHKNSEGYSDPTAYAAMQSTIKEDNALESEVNFLIKSLKFIINKSGYDLLNRIEIRHRKTGRTFR